MSNPISDRLAALGITLPAAPAPAANYVPYVRTGHLLFISGQVPFIDGKAKYIGKVGESVTLDQAIEEARTCGLNILAQAHAATGGDLSQIEQVVKLGGFVACASDFTNHPEVINGASDLMAEVFGDAGQHARFAVGTNALPRGVCVEVEAIFALKS